MPGRYTPGPNAPTYADLQYGSFVQGVDGKPVLAIGGSDGSFITSHVAGSTNTPSIQTSTTALAANPNRTGFNIQNVGVNPLFVLFGNGASTSVFHAVLKGGSSTSDGTGGSLSQTQGTVYGGVVTIAGTSPQYVVTEFTN